MAGEKETTKVAIDKYRRFLHEDHVAGAGTMGWRHGSPPIYDSVNNVFDQGRTKVWPEGCLEETIQNSIKTFEMELKYKTCIKDFRTINPEKFKLFVNGREGLSAEETLKVGGYNALLKNSLPNEFKYHKEDQETFESSHTAFRSAFSRGFAWEVINVYTGPPVVTYKFRHWGFFEGPFKGHAPTAEMIQFYGIGIMKVDKSLRVEELELYYDPAELFGGLLKGPKISESNTEHQGQDDNTTTQHCPFNHN
ncbi:pathogen-related protein-like [Solanum tuberosum]|uniref:Pathogen-related protein n=1 Tax=Solanum tuberosum TaxID=4113 RepID=M1BFL6_SOLTU|nr:PREDICTED: pathogen-related protein-like [Solanum tuberosum]